MKKIKVKEVFDSVRAQLDSTTNFINQESVIDYTSDDSPLGVVLR